MMQVSRVVSITSSTVDETFVMSSIDILPDVIVLFHIGSKVFVYFIDVTVMSRQFSEQY